jgi:hypothetical protein
VDPAHVTHGTRRVSEAGLAEFVDLPENPTNADLAKGIRQLHDCQEAYLKQSRDFHVVASGQIKGLNDQLAPIKDRQLKTASEISKLRKTSLATAKNVKALTDAQYEAGSKLEDLQHKFEAKNGKDKPIIFMGQVELAWKALGLVTFAGGIWRFIEYISPQLVATFQAINGYVMK